MQISDKDILIVIGLVVGLLFVPAPHAHAQPACVHRSGAHATEQGTTISADSRWHVEHGEPPTCKDESSSSGSSGGDDGKSRYCRKRWFC